MEIQTHSYDSVLFVIVTLISIRLLGKENLDAPDLSSTFFNHKVSDSLPFNTSQFTLEELQTCLAKMSKQKASGPDNIPTMLWKDHNFIPNCCASAMKH